MNYSIYITSVTTLFIQVTRKMYSLKTSQNIRDTIFPFDLVGFVAQNCFPFRSLSNRFHCDENFYLYSLKKFVNKFKQLHGIKLQYISITPRRSAVAVKNLTCLKGADLDILKHKVNKHVVNLAVNHRVTLTWSMVSNLDIAAVTVTARQARPVYST